MSERASQTVALAERLVAGSRVAHLDDRLAARIEMRNAVQWLARVAHSYCPAPNEGVRLHFDEEARCVSTPDLAREVRLALQLPGLVFGFHEQGIATPHALDVDDRSSTEIEAWLLAELLHRGFDRSLFHKMLPYTWQNEMSSDELKYNSHRLLDPLQHLTEELVEAAICSRLVRQIASEDVGVTPSKDLLFWPDQCAVGFMLARGDETVRVARQVRDGDAGHFRVSKSSSGLQDIQILNEPDIEAVASNIVKAIRSIIS